MITVKIIYNGDKFRLMYEWLKERNIPLNLGPNVDRGMILHLLKLADFRTERGLVGLLECDVFYFEQESDAILFKLTWG